MALLALVAGAAAAPDALDEDRFEKQVLVAACEDPIQMEVREDGDVYFIERTGRFKRFDAVTGRVRVLTELAVEAQGEIGLIGMALDPGFDDNRWVYLMFSPADRPLVMRLARFTLVGDAIDIDSQIVLLEYPFNKLNNHMSGELEFGPDGNLYIGTGDNTPPIPEFPSDDRPGRENFDALRSAGNTMDLRGKILRIRPTRDGRYDIPPGNLFPGGVGGRPEIYAMGCRNPYRFSIDPRTGWLYFGDVGPNIHPRFGPNGYDEINLVKDAGNYGWPLFVGRNDPYRPYDFATQVIGAPFDPAAPVNRSRNNTGAAHLPPPRPAMIWYPSGDSSEFPELGSGARCAMAGPVYYDDPRHNPHLKLPRHYEGCLFVYDWTRNWIKAVHRDENGDMARIEPFLPTWRLRKPIDMKIAPDGTLYLIEYGDLWFGNTDAQISRIVYRRGNRPPTARASAQPAAGRQPLTVQFSAADSSDRDGDALTYDWRFGIEGAGSTDADPQFTYDLPGIYTVELTVRDPHSQASTATVIVSIGNAVPRVSIRGPRDGGFFDWGRPVDYQVTVEDDEDGSMIAPQRVVMRAEYQTPRPAVDGAHVPASPGESLMRRSTCFACHARDHAALGPTYRDVAQRYRGDSSAHERLAQKILSGGAGAWGPLLMPPHPQHTPDEARQMVGWILSLGDEDQPWTAAGTHGQFVPPRQPPPGRDGGVYVVSASYTDAGAPAAGPQTGTASLTFHARRKNAVLCDESRDVDVLDVFEGGLRQVGQFNDGGYIQYRRVSLADVSYLKVQYAASEGRGGRLELRHGNLSGPLRAALDLPATGEWHHWKQVTAPITGSGELQDLFLVARGTGGSGPLFNIEWVEFLASPPAAQ